MNSEDGNDRNRKQVTETHAETQNGIGSETIGETETAAAAASEPFFDFEKLDVYRVACEFTDLATRVMPGRGHAVLRDQLLRASTAIPFNIAEGASKLTFRDKRKFYDVARGSAGECAAILQNMFQHRLLTMADYQIGRALLIRIVQMLTKLSTSTKWTDRL